MPEIVDPFEKAPRAPAPSPRARQREVSIKAAESGIQTDALRRAEIGASLEKAPVDRARASVALDVDQATKDAAIRKEIAQADDAEYTAKINALKSKYPQLTAEQTLAAARAMLMAEGDKAYSSATSRGYDPGALRNLVAGGLEKVPLAGDTMASMARDPVAQMAVAGQRQFTEGATRSLTGAGLRGDERTFSSSEFFPLPGESPEVRKQKERLRKKYLAQIVQAAGPALKGELMTDTGAAAPTAKPGLPKGFKFLGEAK